MSGVVTQSRTYYSPDQAAVDAVRECLGLPPLYRQSEHKGKRVAVMAYPRTLFRLLGERKARHADPA